MTELSSGSVLARSYGWDATDNLTAIADLIDSARSQMFSYDGLYRLTFAQGVYGSYSYQYDALGNRTALDTDTASTSYSYVTASNRLISVDEGPGPVPVAYDPAGNTVDDGERQFSYNARNRLSEADGHEYGHNAQNLRVFKPRFGLAGDASGDGQITEADLTLLQQALNGQGTATLAMDCNQDGVVDQRDTPCIARQIGSNRNQGQGNGRGQGNRGGDSGPPPAPNTEPVQVGWVLFTHDEQGRLIGEYDEQGNPLRRYIWLDDLPVALIDQTGVHYIHSDHLNTPQAVTDSTGTVVWAADYAPFGEVTETVSQVEMNLRFPGQYHDRETGLHQNWHREYDPHLGRYTQSDPIGLNGGMNTFAYVGGSPVRGIDPLGLVEWTADFYGGGFFYVGGVGVYRFNLQSDCVDGVRASARVLFWGSGLGYSVGYTTVPVDAESGLRFRDSNTRPNPWVFHGMGGMAIGGLSIAPNSWGFREITLGGAEYIPGTGQGVTGAIEIGGAVMTGSSTLLSSEVTECEC